MKKFMYLFASMFMVSTLTFAQSKPDTIRDERQQIPVLPAEPSVAPESNEEWILISEDNLPVELVKTLQRDEYMGWKDSGVYRNRNSGQFSVEIKSRGGIRKYRFDKDGSPLDGLSTLGGFRGTPS